MGRRFSKQNLGEKLTEELGVPKQIMPGYNHIELYGNHEAHVNNCAGILEYSEEKIKINMGKNAVTFAGNGLSIKEYGSSFAVIEGDILDVSFS